MISSQFVPFPDKYRPIRYMTTCNVECSHGRDPNKPCDSHCHLLGRRTGMYGYYLNGNREWMTGESRWHIYNWLVANGITPDATLDDGNIYLLHLYRFRFSIGRFLKRMTGDKVLARDRWEALDYVRQWPGEKYRKVQYCDLVMDRRTYEG